VEQRSRDLREIEDWLSPSEAAALIGTSGQWVTQLAREGKLDSVRTSLGWLINPVDAERLASERLERAEKKVAAMKSARSTGVARSRRRGIAGGKAKLGSGVGG
jgi:hypothetical protein